MKNYEKYVLVPHPDYKDYMERADYYERTAPLEDMNAVLIPEEWIEPEGIDRSFLHSYIDNLPDEKYSVLFDFIRKVTRGDKRDACKFAGIEGSIDTAIPNGILNDTKELCEDIHPLEFVYQYDENHKWGGLRNPFIASMRKLIANLHNA